MWKAYGISNEGLKQVISDQNLIIYERSSIYQVVDRALNHALMSSACCAFADTACIKSPLHGSTVWITSENREYRYQLEKMLDIINIEEVIYDWARTRACLRGDTGISLLDGSKPTIREMAEVPGSYIGKFVWSVNPESKQLEVDRITGVFKTKKNAELVRVTLESGEKFGGRSYGRAFRVWVVYQRIVLRLPYRVIPRVIEDMFGVGMGTDSVTHFLDNIAAEYCETERMMIEQMLQGPFIHADETRISNQGVDHYVWVFTDSKHVVLRMTETREATIVHDFLKGYQGVLISDFYPGYASVACRQQKCWAHLIRDINEDLWKNPFNAEFEIFVSEVRNLIIPIFKTVDKCGLKKRNLNKFKRSVDRFYKKIINNRIYEFEATQKFHKRFDRYQESLFMFLNQDNIPWNNNMAERALRELAVQRKIFGSFSKSVGPQYLMLLGLSQSCRFQEKSFLKFLLSKEKDIDAFRVTKRKKISILAGAVKSEAPIVADENINGSVF